MSAEDRIKQIGLCMIVKNEAHVIVRCLDSVRPLIDYVLIEDTGSTDGTQEVIRNWLADNNVPGAVIEEPWRDFAYNRSHGLAELRKNTEIDYALIIDADDVLRIAPNTDIDRLKGSLCEGSYSINIHNGSLIFHRTQICSNKLPFRFRGVLHEFLECAEGSPTSGHLNEITIDIVGGGARSANPQKYLRDAEVIERALLTEEDAFLRSRYTFYLAQSYRDFGDRQSALRNYLARADMGFWIEEVYLSLLHAARLKEALGYDADDVLSTFKRASEAVPGRLEAIHGACRYCRLAGRNREGYEIAKPAIGSGAMAVPGGLFIESWIYKYGLLDEFSINAYWAGEYHDSLDACLRILESGDLPADQQPRVIANARYAMDRLEVRSPNLGSAGSIDFVDQYPLQPARDLRPRVLSEPRVLLAILAQQKEAELPLYLECIDRLTYPKSRIFVYIRVHNSTDRTRELLEDWARTHQDLYAGLEFDSADMPDMGEKAGLLGAIRNESLSKTLEKRCDFYFVCDANNFIRPETLTELVALDLPICAPFLRGENPNTFYSNYHAEVDQNGYYAPCDQYNWIVSRYVRGVIEVPVVNCTYLVRADVIGQLTNRDGGNRPEYVIFSESARKAGIAQYIDNRQVYGYVAFQPDEISRIGQLIQSNCEARLEMSYSRAAIEISDSGPPAMRQSAANPFHLLLSLNLTPLLWESRRPNYSSAWHGHVPFAHWLVSVTRPKSIVELGTHYGVSYAAFCHAVASLGLDTKCHAIDSWKGDTHSGFYGEDVYADLLRFNDNYYSGFSRLIRGDFDEAVERFENRSIDILHIDGLHTYQAVKHDFETWHPKLSEQAVVLFHDTCVVNDEFGVWKFWNEMRTRFPSFNFRHSSGLGVLAVGERQSRPILSLCAVDDGDQARLSDVFEKIAILVRKSQ